jgi:cytoskeleton protein RodZ
VGTFGERLQRERELRGITLDEIADATKIGKRSLRALEEEDFGTLPGGIFNKGFVRAYAHYLGIDEEQAVTDYLAAVKAQAAARTGTPAQAVAAAPPAPSPAQPGAAEAHTPIQARLGVALATGAILLAAASFTLWKFYPSDAADPAEEQVSIAVPTALPDDEQADLAALAEEEEAEEAATPGGEAAPAAEPGGFVLLVRARERAWVSVVADGRTVYEGEMDAADTRTVRARREVVFRTGNAGGVELSHNGSVLADIGPPGQVRTVTVTPEGVRR